MFDTKKYHREYMRTYRERVERTPEQKAVAAKFSREYWARKKLDPVWVEKNRKRLREAMREKRKDPAVRKAAYKRHTEWARRNKDHLNAKARKRNAIPENQRKRKAKWLEKKYGLTLEQYEAKIAKSGGKCPICKEPLGAKAATDHDHATGKVRDVLCASCNRWIGFIENNRQLVKPMLKYLDRWNRIIKQTA